MRRLVAISLVAACGGSSTPAKPDADLGFNKPTASLKANMEVSTNNWMELGPANLSCLNTPSSDVTATVDITFNTMVLDFQSGNPVPGVGVQVFPDIDITNPIGAGATADSTGAISIPIPMGHKRIGFKMTKTDDGTSLSPLDTFLLNQYFDPTTATQTLPTKIQTISKATAATLPALIGETRTVGTGVAAGALRDCDVHEMSNFVTTISSTSGTPTPIVGAESFYFSDAVGLPVHHNQEDSASKDGLFMLIQVPPADTAYVQAWGYPTDADVTADNLQLISELQVPVLADTVITGSFEPLRK